MATIEGLTKARMLDIEDATIVDADTSSGHLILTKKSGDEIDGGPIGSGGGEDGESAYQIAVDHGFSGTEAEWLASLKGDPGTPGTATLPDAYHLGSSSGPTLLPSDFRDGLDLRDFVDTAAGLLLRPDSAGQLADNLATDHMPIFKAAWNALIAQGRGKLRVPFLGSQYRGNVSAGTNPLSGIYRLKLPTTGTDLLPAFNFETLSDIIEIEFDRSGIYTGATDWGWARTTPQAWNGGTYYSNVAAAVIRAYNASSGKFLKLRGLHLRGPDISIQTGAYARNPKVYDPGLIMQGIVVSGRCHLEDSIFEGMHVGVNIFGDHITCKRVMAQNNTINWLHDLTENQKDNVFDTCFGSKARLASRAYHAYMVRDTDCSWEHGHMGMSPFDKFRMRYSLPRNDGAIDGTNNFSSAGTNLCGAKPVGGSNWEQKLEVNDWIIIHDQLASHTGPSAAAMFGYRYVVTGVVGAGNVVQLTPDVGSPALVINTNGLVFSMQKAPSNCKGNSLEEWIVGSEQSDLTSENVGQAHIYDDAELPFSTVVGQKMDAPQYSGLDDNIMFPLSAADPTTPAYSGTAGGLTAGATSQFNSAGAGFVAATAKDSWLEILGLAIASIDGSGVITTVGSHHLCAGDSVYFVSGANAKSYYVSNNASLTQTTLALTAVQTGTTTVNPGAFAAGAYLARMTRKALQIASIVPGATTLINFSARQALVTSDKITLNGITGTMADLLNGQSLSATYITATQISVPVNTTGLAGAGGYAYRDSARGFFDTIKYFRITDVPDSTHLTLEVDPQVNEVALAWRVVLRPRMHARVGQLRECTMPHSMGTDTWWGGENFINCQDPPFACKIVFQEPVLPAAKTYLDDSDPPGTAGGLPPTIQVVNFNDDAMNALRSIAERGDGQYILARPLPGSVIHRGELVSVTQDAANGLWSVRPCDPSDAMPLGAVAAPGGPACTLVWVGKEGVIPHVRFPWAVTTPGAAIVADQIAKGFAREQGDHLSGFLGFRTDSPVNGFCPVYFTGAAEQVGSIREMIGQFGKSTTLAATATDPDIPIMGGSNSNQKFAVCMRSGFVTGLSLNLFPIPSAGQAVATVFKNGVATALTVQIGPTTWPQAKTAVAAIGAIPFKAGDVLSVSITTTGLSVGSYPTAGIEVGY